MEKKYNFVYLTTNLITGKQYVGDHSTNDLECWKSKNYLGSGKYFKNALNEYKKENFKREILEFFDTKEEAFIAQEKYINEYNTLTPNGYNISPKGGLRVKGCFSEETKKKLRKPLSIEHKQKIINKLTGHYVSEETRKKQSFKKIGKKQTLQAVEKRRQKLKGRKHTDEAKEKIRNSAYMMNRPPVSDETRKKQSEARKGKVSPNKGKKYIIDENNIKRIIK